MQQFLPVARGVRRYIISLYRIPLLRSSVTLRYALRSPIPGSDFLLPLSFFSYIP